MNAQVTLKREVRHPYEMMRAIVVDGPEGVMSLTWNWTRKPLPESSRKFFAIDEAPDGGQYYAADLGIHWRSRLEYSQRLPDNEFCEFTQGPCWYDGSSLNAERVGKLYLAVRRERGELDALEYVYKELTEWYRSRAQDKEVD